MRQRGAKLLGVGTALLVVMTVVPKAEAVILNAGFESGDFTSWSTIGDASVVTSGFGSGPTEGIDQALLTTASEDGDGSNFSGTDAVSADDLETFLGLAPGSLAGLGNGTPTEGSALKQTFSANAGDVLSFDWNFLTNENTPGVNDFAFATINPLSTLADTNFSPFVSSLTSDFAQETGFRTFTFTIPTTGTYTGGAGVVDVDDTEVTSGLLVDNFALTPSTQPTPVIPEPSSILLFGAGLLGLARFGRRGVLLFTTCDV